MSLTTSSGNSRVFFGKKFTVCSRRGLRFLFRTVWPWGIRFFPPCEKKGEAHSSSACVTFFSAVYLPETEWAFGLLSFAR